MMVSDHEPKANELVRPTSLERARAEMAADPRLRPIGGGTAIVPNLRAGATSGRWMTTTSIQGLDGVSVDAAGALIIGAGARLRQLERDPRVREGWPLLATALAAIAGPAIRNAATVGGSLALGRNSPDPAVALDVFGASVAVAHAPQDVAIRHLPVTSDAARPLFIERVRVPAARTYGWDYQRFTVRGGADQPFVIVAVVVSESGTCVRVGVGRPRPVQLEKTEAAIDAGADWRASLDGDVAALMLRNTDRGTGSYRARVLTALTARAIEAATRMERGG